MGKMKKLMALLACTAMVAGSIAGCGSSSDTSAPAPAEPAVSEPAGESAEAGSEAAQGDSQVVSEESGTLRMYGPGAFCSGRGKRNHRYDYRSCPSGLQRAY